MECRFLCSPAFKVEPTFTITNLTVEAIFLPVDRESTPELELETHFVWLPAERTRGWLSSHVARLGLGMRVLNADAASGKVLDYNPSQ